VTDSGELRVEGTSDAANELERCALEAAKALSDARALGATLHEPGERERYRALLERAIERADRALALGDERSAAPPGGARARLRDAAVTAARSTLAKAHAAKARDALHGAGQLSRSAQRAPTLDACNEGWIRVAAISAGAAASARIAARLAAELERDAPGSRLARTAHADARAAEIAARAAQRVVDERNHAYTFHTDGGFSFGEGWYLAAAAVLADVTIQIEPDKEGTPAAERFLRDAGLAGKVRPYRSRPRAMKHVTELVARGFAVDPTSAQAKLRAAFLGETPEHPEVSAWVDRRLREAPAEMRERRKVLLWIRDGVHHPSRNTSVAELRELTVCVEKAGLVPVWTGDALRGERVPPGVIDMILFWKDPLFLGLDRRRAQLAFFEHLRERHGLVGQLGVTTAGMDGPALLGLPTIYLTEESNVRMREWVGAVPGYEEVVRGGDYLERVRRSLSTWATAT
jgi:hypothetical protein